RALVLLHSSLQPAGLFAPERVARDCTARDIVDVAIQNDEMRRAPIERVIRCRYIEELVVLRVVTLVIAERWKECGFAQKFTLDVEEDRPLRGVGAIGHQVT